MSTTVADPISTPHAMRHDAGLAVVLTAAGVVLFVLALRQGGALLASLPGTRNPDHGAQSLLLLQALMLAGGGLLWILAILSLLLGSWLRRQDVLNLLELRFAPALVALVALHVASMFFYLPMHELLSPDPIVTCDSSYHYYQVFAAHRLLSQAGHSWGYDPYFMAGYPAGVFFDLDMKGAELFCHLFAWLGLPYAYKAFIVLAFVLFPVAMYAAARLLGLERGEALAALGLALLYWHWGRPLVGHFRWAGMHSYVLASYLGVLTLSLACRGLQATGRARRACCAGLVATTIVATQVHPLAIPQLAPGLLVLYAGSFRRLRSREHLALALGLVLVLAANADWLLPSLRFLHYKTRSDFWFQFRGLKDVVFVYSRKTSLIFSTITVLGVAGLVRMRRRDRLSVAAVSASLAAYFLAAFYGARLRPVADTEPGRYLLPFAFLMTLPAGTVLVSLLRRVQRAAGPPLVATGLVCAAGSIPYLALAENRFLDVHIVSATIDARFRELLGFLERNTTRQARILFETPGGFYDSTPLLYGGHLQALVPIYTNREVIGGPYPVNFILHAAVDFKNAELCGRPLREWKPGEFQRFLDTYNIGWVVCWSASSRAFFEARPDARSMGEFDRFAVYAVRRTPSWVLAGEGQVSADYNRLEVHGASGGEIVLAYHWLESLRSTPPLALEPVAIAGDPIPFIRVRPGGTRDFVIYNEY